MKKIGTSLIGMLVLLAACQKQDLTKPSQQATNKDSGQTIITQRTCGSYDVLQRQLAEDPTLAKRMDDIETFTQKVASNPSAMKLVNGLITIPVVVHVVYNTAAQNISDAQVRSQIDVLNEDYGNTNADKVHIPAEFKPVDGTIGIRFTLDRIIRKSTTITSFNSNDAIKKSEKGGDDAVDATSYLNVWTGNLSGGLLGYAQFPGGNLATDGVVILYDAFGRRGNLIAKYNLGRSATHEIGHWMNLIHIWGDKNCGTDKVDDTPQANAANYDCPAYPHKSTCSGKVNEMTMNYMDYTDDACMDMFSNGQKSRMLATFATGGFRAKMAQR
jgi:hypothetical protein